MTSKHFCILLLAVVAAGTVAGQSDDNIPIENDNQFPPDNHLESDGAVIEGSGEGTLEEPVTIAESTPVPQLELVKSQSAMLHESEPANTSDADQSCPSPCVCNIEGGSDNFVVDCSGYGLTEFPSPLDPRTTTLNIQNNKLTEIPKELSTLKNLKVLNADSNLIMDLASGSISELAELTVLKLSNNRLLEFPKDLKNSFSLIKLEELDLGDNDMRTSFKPEFFSNFISIRKVTLPSSTPELVGDLCSSLKNTLETVCTKACSTQSDDCPDTPQKNEEDLLDITIPGMIAFDENESDPSVDSPQDQELINSGTEDTPLEPLTNTNDITKSDGTEVPIVTNENDAPPNGVSLHRASVNMPEEATDNKLNSITVDAPKEVVDNTHKDELTKIHTEFPSLLDPRTSTVNILNNRVIIITINSTIDAPKEEVDNTHKDELTKTESDVKVGAATTDAKTGGVDKSVIGMIVAGMVVVVAGITIKKNWSSIRNRFSSTPRPSQERTGANGTSNGTSPEEVPLQDKSPV